MISSCEKPDKSLPPELNAALPCDLCECRRSRTGSHELDPTLWAQQREELRHRSEGEEVWQQGKVAQGSPPLQLRPTCPWVPPAPSWVRSHFRRHRPAGPLHRNIE